MTPLLQLECSLHVCAYGLPDNPDSLIHQSEGGMGYLNEYPISNDGKMLRCWLYAPYNQL